MPTYPLGRVEPPNLAHLREASYHRHVSRLRELRNTPLPSHFDSVARGWVGPVKDQSQCGLCWCFSGTCVVEVAYNKAGIGGGPRKFVLSEQYTLDCGDNGGCDGDDNTTLLTWAKATGLPLATQYGSYDGGAQACAYTSSEKLYEIRDWGFADSNGGQGVTPVNDIKAAILAHGCVGAAIAADDAFMNNPSDTVFLGSGSTDVNHDIVLVGWDDTKGMHGAWKLRNSWGPGWCDEGYCWISYRANEVGTEAVFAVVNTIQPPKPPTPHTPLETARTAIQLPEGNYKVTHGEGTLVYVPIP